MRKTIFKINEDKFTNFKSFVNENFLTQFLDLNNKDKTKLFLNDFYDLFEQIKYGKNVSIDKSNYWEYQNYLYENLNYSVSPEELYNSLNKLKYKTIQEIYFNNDSFIGWQCYLILNNNINDYNECIIKIDKICHNFKWYYNKDQVLGTDNKQYILLTFNPIYDEELTDFVYNNLNGILYHFCPNVETPKNNTYDKLVNNGLMLKSQNIRDHYPPRIYMYMNISNKNKEIYCKNLYNKISNNYKKQHINFYYLIKVDLKQNSYNIRLFKDKYAQNAVYTMENIHPKCLEIIDKIYV